MMITN